MVVATTAAPTSLREALVSASGLFAGVLAWLIDNGVEDLMSPGFRPVKEGRVSAAVERLAIGMEKEEILEVVKLILDEK